MRRQLDTAQKNPLKWLKYELLLVFDLLDKDELYGSIRRYRVGDHVRLRNDLESGLADAASRSERLLFVVKLVPWDAGGQLPNLRIENEGALESLPTFVAKAEDRGFVEIWSCSTRVDPGIFSVAGRWSFSDEELPRSQVLEQVWRCSPRLIEQYNKHFPYPYVRAIRPSWGWRWRIEEHHASGSTAEDLAAQRAEFTRAAHRLEAARERLGPFLQLLRQLGFKSFSLEYKLVNAHVDFIDWDTPDDRRVLASYNMRLLH